MDTPPNLHFEFIFTYEDNRAALRTMNRRLLFSRPMLGWIYIFVFAALLFYIFHHHSPLPPSAPPVPAALPTAASDLLISMLPYLLMAAFIAILLLKSLADRRRRWEKESKNELNQVTLSPEGIFWETHASRIETKWIAYEKFAEGPTVFILYVAAKRGAILPKRVMTPDQIAQVRKLFIQNIGKAKGFEVLHSKTNPL